MNTIAGSIYRDAAIGSTVVLSKVGTWLDDPYFYDASARDIKGLAKRGLVKIVSERKAACGDEAMITELVFTKLG